MIAAPSTYMVDGKQYVSIAVGWGGAYGVSQRDQREDGPGTVFTFALGGKAPRRRSSRQARGPARGRQVRPQGRCPKAAACTSATACCATACPASTAAATSRTSATSAPRDHQPRSISLQGLFAQGMPDFTGKLTEGDVAKIKAFIQGTADAIRPKSR